MRYLAILLSCTLLIGCCTNPVIVPEKIEVPIAVKCEPVTTITVINHAYDRATPEMSLYEKFQLALEELNSVNGQNKELTAALKECTK
jgi:uncharacterized lipoprotein YajG